MVVVVSLVYRQFPGLRGKPQGGFLDGLDLFFGQFSVNFPDKVSVKNRQKSLFVLKHAF